MKKVNEPAVAFAVQRFGFMNRIFADPSLGQVIHSYVDFVTVAQRGLKQRLIWPFLSYFGLKPSYLAGLINTSPKTIYSWRDSETLLEPGKAVLLLALADLFEYGTAVFEDRDAFMQWVQAPNRALGGRRPDEFLQAPYGIEKIKELLGRIEFGVYS